MKHDERDIGLIVDVWSNIKPYLEKKEKEEAAMSFVRTLEEYFNVEDMVDDLLGHDSILDSALSEVYNLDAEEEEEDDDYEELNWDDE